ncbi:MAG TPA: hypothetical protein VFF30_00730 [Nitrososphaerales archaeon]|nr:hypothetical protein [Nitrososphaerales archaeon]
MTTLTELALYAGLIGAGIVGVWMLIGAFRVRGIETPKYITLERKKGGYEI